MNEEKQKYVPDHTIANRYRKYGGMIPHLMKTVEGMRGFVYEQLMVKCNTSDVFLDEFKKRFPDLKEIPSIYTVSEFKKKINKAEKGWGDNTTTALAMRDEVRNMKAFGDLNLVEEEIKLYQKSKKLLERMEKIMLNAYDQVKQMSMPPDFFWNAVQNYQKVLETRGQRLAKLDDLAVRYGYAPPKQMDKNLILAQQNIGQININSEVQNIIDELGIKNDKDLIDDEFFKSKIKQVSEIISSNGESVREEEEVVEDEGKRVFFVGENELEKQG